MQLSEVKKYLNKEVYYKTGKYKLTGCILRQNERNNEFFYVAELLDLTSNRSIAYCRLSDVKLKNPEQALECGSRVDKE